MYSFKNDYSEGAHPSILKALAETNDIQFEGYGLDDYSLLAVNKIKSLIEDNDAIVHFIPGGTQSNLLAIASFLRPHEAVISVQTGHIATHETGAIEATGHKILEAKHSDGKVTVSEIKRILTEHHFEHMVKPKMVYISNPTEFGTVYTLEELNKLRQICDQNELYFYCDGARLGSALMSESCDYVIRDLHNLFDAFFIGGTKNGALIGEAMVLKNNEMKSEFRYLMKQRGALLSKGRVLGVQFFELFKDNLYFDLASHANQMADVLRNGIKESGGEFLLESDTNQLFPIMSNTLIEALEDEFEFYVWQPVDDDRSAIRLITSWATKRDNVESFVEEYKRLKELI